MNLQAIFFFFLSGSSLDPSTQNDVSQSMIEIILNEKISKADVNSHPQRLLKTLSNMSVIPGGLSFPVDLAE